MSDYADAKANIFRDQNEGDFLILNKQNRWTKYFLTKKPKSNIFYVSMSPLTGKANGVYAKNNFLIFRADTIEQRLFSVKKFTTTHGSHNLANLMAAVLAVKLFDPEVTPSEKDILRLTLPTMRQEEVFKKGKLRVINDSCATSPDGTIAALSRFKKEGRVVLIAGGTDKMLDFRPLGVQMRKFLSEDDVILLDGSGTRMLHEVLRGYNPSTYETLNECVAEAARRVGEFKKVPTIVLFSPGAASFEKFLHEFDRGMKFNKLVKKYFK